MADRVEGVLVWDKSTDEGSTIALVLEVVALIVVVAAVNNTVLEIVCEVVFSKIGEEHCNESATVTDAEGSVAVDVINCDRFGVNEAVDTISAENIDVRLFADKSLKLLPAAGTPDVDDDE